MSCRSLHATMTLRRAWDVETLNRVYDKTDGYCGYCGKKLAWCNHGAYGARAAWQVDHSKPLSRGGTNHLNNLVPACIPCNQEKGTMTGPEFKHLSEYAPAAQSNPWADLAGVVVGAIAVGLFLRWLSEASRQR